MQHEVWILIVEAMAVYLLVLGTHALRRRFGLAPFYALLGGVTAVMSWITDAGVAVEVGGVTFMVGSTVFYTALLLGVFVVYVFDGPRATRIAIYTVAGVSALVPLIAVVLHVQMRLMDSAPLGYVPVPSLRTNAASVVATVADLVFLAMVWECLGRWKWSAGLWLRAFLALLGVMIVDVLLFATGAFAGTPGYVAIMQGTMLSRLMVAGFAWPLLYAYLEWQNRQAGLNIENRPVLAILKEVAEVRGELGLAHREIARREKLEREREELIGQLQATIARVRKLEGLLSICSSCKRIRLAPEEPGAPERWVPLDRFMQQETTVRFSHGLCEDCLRRGYPEVAEDVLAEARRERTEGKE